MNKTIQKTLRHAAQLLAGSAAVFAGLAPVAHAQTYAITNARLEMVGSVDAPRHIETGTLVIRNGRIAAVGSAVSVPNGATVIDAEGGSVTPGIFASLSGLGLEEISLDREGNDRSPRSDVGIVAAMDATDGLYTDSTIIPISRAGGVTRALVALDTGSALFSGCAAVIDLTGSASPITRNCAATMASLGYGGARKVGDSRPAALAVFRAALDDVAAFMADPFLYRRTVDERRLSAADAEALVPVLRGDRKLLIEVHGAPDIRRVLDLAAEYDLDIALVGASEAHRVADELAAADVAVILNPLGNLPSNFERFGATLAAGGILAAAGVDVAFYDDDIGYTHNLRLLPQLAGNAVANGMDRTAALAAITAIPAKLYGLENQMGTLQAGKLADVVIWDGDPLEVTVRPTHVFIGGKPASLDNRQAALVRRYRDLDRGALPHAYRGD